jgi:ferrous iron transport protein B
MSTSQKSLEQIALVGSPNAGKTTLYNRLTGSRYKTVNYPGTTVEFAKGKLLHSLGGHLELIDTPGTYSMEPKGPDEVVTHDTLFPKNNSSSPDGLVVVVDSTQMSRHLILALQIKESGYPMVIALTMADLIKKENLSVDILTLEKEMGVRVIPINGLNGDGVKDLVKSLGALSASEKKPTLPVWSHEQKIATQQRAQKLADKILTDLKSNQKTNVDASWERLSSRTLAFDRYLTHPVLGLIIFILVMFGLFSSIFWMAKPAMDLVDTGFTWTVAKIISLAPKALWTDFLGNGIVASFGAVLVFVPQIFILFIGIGILESTGYLARAAALVDKPLSLLGLSGRSFVPLLSGFACAVPAIMATRNLTSTRDRWITNFTIPLMTCSARLPVYGLLLSFVFRGAPAWKAGLAMSLLYFGSIVLGAIAAGIVNKILSKTQKSFFMMDMPLYRRPRFRVLFVQSFHRTIAYVRKAGPTIFVIAVILWTLTTFPAYQEQDGGVKLTKSYAGHFGQVIEPIFKPMGVDWRVGVGLMSAFGAREVFVSSLAVTFNLADSEDKESMRRGLVTKMSEATFADGSPIFTLASVIGLIVFFMIAMQCMSTFAVVVREMGSLKFALFQLVVYNLIAYVVTVVLVQGLRAIGIA